MINLRAALVERFGIGIDFAERDSFIALENLGFRVDPQTIDGTVLDSTIACLESGGDDFLVAGLPGDTTYETLKELFVGEFEQHRYSLLPDEGSACFTLSLGQNEVAVSVSLLNNNIRSSYRAAMVSALSRDYDGLD